MLAAALSCVTTAGAQQTAPASPNNAPLLRYVTEQILMAASVRPHQLLTNTALLNTLKTIEAEALPQQISQSITKTVGLDPLKIEQLMVVIDHPTLSLIRQQYSQPAISPEELLGKEAIGQALSSFHDVNGHFPSEDGFGKSKGKLSWRVHLLPYLDQQELYEQFHFEEPWDSDHNKTLIEKMPDAFRVTGIAEPGRTSVHIPVGAGTLFSGDEPPTMHSITDKPESTILAVVADPGTAEIWTKPGGLKTDMTDPVSSFSATSPTITACMASGYTVTLNRTLTPDHWRWLLRHNDGHWTLPLPAFPAASRIPPALLVRFTEDIDPQKTLAGIVGTLQTTQQPFAGLTGYRIDSYSTAVFPDSRTLLISNADSLQQMLEPRNRTSRLRQQLEKLLLSGDVVAVGDLAGTRALLTPPASDDQPATTHMISQEQFTLHLDATGSSPNLLELIVTCDDQARAEQFIQLINLLTEMMQQGNPHEHGPSQSPLALLVSLMQFLDAPAFKRQDGIVSLTVPRPVNISPLFAKLQTKLKDLASEYSTAENLSPQTQQEQALADVAEAFSSFHDINGCFPNWKKFEGSDAGLSWRVHLLQALDPDLYIRFHMDEPWDSPHNKTLIAEMPAAFRTPGVTEPGQTSLHVFLGPNTICGADETYSMGELSAPGQNLVAFVAGPDTAEIWTKPTGLQYDPADPVKSLGRIGETFQAVGAGQGQVVELERNMAPAELRQAIERSPSD